MIAAGSGQRSARFVDEERRYLLDEEHGCDAGGRRAGVTREAGGAGVTREAGGRV